MVKHQVLSAFHLKYYLGLKVSNRLETTFMTCSKLANTSLATNYLCRREQMQRNLKDNIESENESGSESEDSQDEEVIIAVIESSESSSSSESDKESMPLIIRSRRRQRTTFKTRHFWGDSD